MTKAWMLRQDGKAFEIMQHLYAMQDDDLSSEAEVCSFLIATKSKDIELAKYVLDAWMAMLIEDSIGYTADNTEILNTIRYKLNHLPYKFPYSLTEDEFIDIHIKQNNYTDIDSLYDFIDGVRSKLSDIQDKVNKSINQQFCRVRYGGKYNDESGNNGIWFRISSVSYNWADTIYIFTATQLKKLNINKISICRDNESDNGFIGGGPDYFYKAKDGAVYYDMPINEFLEEEHEHSLVFSALSINSGILASIQSRLKCGHTINEVSDALMTEGAVVDAQNWTRLLNKERKLCIESSEYMDNAPTRTQNRLMKMMKQIKRTYPEISNIDLDYKPRANTKGNMVGCEYIFTLSSDYDEINNLHVSVVFLRNDVTADNVFNRFCKEYDDYLTNKNIRL